MNIHVAETKHEIGSNAKIIDRVRGMYLSIQKGNTVLTLALIIHIFVILLSLARYFYVYTVTLDIEAP